MNTNRRIVVAVLTAVMLAAVMAVATRVVDAQSSQRMLRVDVNQSIFGGSLYVAGVCDPGNGTMVYVAYTSGLVTQPQIGITAVPNGCKKESKEER